MSLFIVALFVVLTPGILVTLPSKGSSKLTVAVVHGLAFALLYSLLEKAVWHYLYEGFTSHTPSKKHTAADALASPSVAGFKNKA